MPEKQIYDFIKDKSSIIIFEEGDPLIEEAIYIIAQKNGLNLLIKGKLDGCLSKEGEHSLETVEKTLLPPEQQSPKTSYNITSLSLPVRAPVLCPGCPHLGSFYILKKVFGKNSIFAGDIGCYTLGIQLNAIDICLCMGAGINMGAGISKFEKERNVISIIGDSTFFHSGITGLINSCYNNSNHIISILDNRTTAMTGHQPHPGTGTTASGEKTININIEQLALISGANKVITLDPYLINESIEKLKHFKESKGVRVVIFKRECIFVARAPITKFYVDKEKCTGCKLCLQVKCPAIVFSNGKAEITNQCIGCSICAEICPFNAIQEKDNVK